MNKLFLAVATIAMFLAACNNNPKQAESTSTNSTEQTNQKFACSMHPEVIGNKGEKCSKCGMELTEPVTQKEETHNHDDGSHEHESKTTVEENTQVAKTTAQVFSTSEIVRNYLTLKNALIKDDAKGAGSAGKVLYATLTGVNANSIDAKQKMEYFDIADDAKEHAEHIGANADKIEHQREHFALLSKDINDLIKLFGSSQKLYQDFCPMYDDGKGAIWISEIKEIKNPYLGAKMPTCGSIKKEY